MCGHRKWKETKQQPVTTGPGIMLGCFLDSFHFLWAILCPHSVHLMFYAIITVYLLLLSSRQARHILGQHLGNPAESDVRLLRKWGEQLRRLRGVAPCSIELLRWLTGIRLRVVSVTCHLHLWKIYCVALKSREKFFVNSVCMPTACGHRMAHRKWKEIKQQPSMLPGPAVPGFSLVSFHFLWAILCPQAVWLSLNMTVFETP